MVREKGLNGVSTTVVIKIKKKQSMRYKELILQKLDILEGKQRTLAQLAQQGNNINEYHQVLNESHQLIDEIKSLVDREN